MHFSFSKARYKFYILQVITFHRQLPDYFPNHWLYRLLNRIPKARATIWQIERVKHETKKKMVATISGSSNHPNRCYTRFSTRVSHRTEYPTLSELTFLRTTPGRTFTYSGRGERRLARADFALEKLLTGAHWASIDAAPRSPAFLYPLRESLVHALNLHSPRGPRAGDAQGTLGHAYVFARDGLECLANTWTFVCSIQIS